MIVSLESRDGLCLVMIHTFTALLLLLGRVGLLRGLTVAAGSARATVGRLWLTIATSVWRLRRRLVVSITAARWALIVIALVIAAAVVRRWGARRRSELGCA